MRRYTRRREEDQQVSEVIQVGSQHYILAISSRADDRTWVLKSGDALPLSTDTAIFNRSGLVSRACIMRGPAS